MRLLAFTGFPCLKTLFLSPHTVAKYVNCRDIFFSGIYDMIVFAALLSQPPSKLFTLKTSISFLFFNCSIISSTKFKKHEENSNSKRQLIKYTKDKLGDIMRVNWTHIITNSKTLNRHFTKIFSEYQEKRGTYNMALQRIVLVHKQPQIRKNNERKFRENSQD